MKNYFYFVLLLLATNTINAQAWDMSLSNKDGVIFYNNGETEKGKLSFDRTKLSIRNEDKKRKLVDVSTVDKFVVYKKKDTLTYTYIMSERNYKKQKRYLAGLEFDGEKIRLYNEPTTAATIGAFSVSKKVLFFQKKEEPYATQVVKAYKNVNTVLKEYFENCPSLVSKIGTDGYEYKNITSILEYYETQCSN